MFFCVCCSKKISAHLSAITSDFWGFKELFDDLTLSDDQGESSPMSFSSLNRHFVYCKLVSIDVHSNWITKPVFERLSFIWRV